MQNAIEQSEKPFVVEEISDPLSYVDKFLDELPIGMQNLFLAVRQSEEWSLVRDIVSEVSEQNSKRHIELRKGVAGYLFEALSYNYLSEQLTGENKILLSPGETLEIYHRLYPNGRKTINRFGLQKSIDRITVPDGMVIEFSSRKEQRVDIVAACEYSLSNPKDYFEEAIIKDYSTLFTKDMHQITGPITDQSRGITDYIRSKCPQFPSNARFHSNGMELLIVAPVGVNLPFSAPNIKEFTMPISTLMFRRFVGAFMADVQAESSLGYVQRTNN